MIDPNDDLFIWGPIDGRPIYVSYFMIAIAKRLTKQYQIPMPEIHFFFVGDQMTFVSPNKGWSGTGAFSKWLMKDSNLKRLKNEYKGLDRNLDFYR